jgi:hypothetical protein
MPFKLTQQLAGISGKYFCWDSVFVNGSKPKTSMAQFLFQIK